MPTRNDERALKEVDEMEVSQEKKKGKKKNTDEEIPLCTTAPSAEHARAADDDEPCDDGREGKTDKD